MNQNSDKTQESFRRGRRVKGTTVASYAALIVATVFSLAPLFWALSTSLKIKTLIYAYPPKWLPIPLTFENYYQVLFHSHLPRHLINTVVVAFISIFIVLAISIHAAYAAARLRFRGREFTSFVILGASMVPIISLLTPLYGVWTRIGLFDTYIGLSLAYAAWQVPTAIWFIRGFVEAIPRELEEAAMVDGCSRWKCLYRIVLPIIQPGLAASGILIFIYIWNDFLLATTLTISEERRLVQVGLYHFINDTGVDWGRFMAHTSVGTLPIILMFIALQRRLLRGLVAGAMKG
jgi:ABC-type glycerol-3-phosphate transport system permease component